MAKSSSNLKIKSILIVGSVLLIAITSYFLIPKAAAVKYFKNIASTAEIDEAPKILGLELEHRSKLATHIKTPVPVRGLYMSSWVAGTPSIRSKLVELADKTEINALIIDIKDYTGRISFEVNDPKLRAVGSAENRIPDIFNFIEMLHQKNIYVIGRIAVFQDPYLIKSRPELAVKKLSDTSAVWRDHKGIGWLDAGSKEVWDYAATIAREAYGLGFDELNFDYIRFPSDGNMKDIYYPISNGRIKAEVVKEFFQYLRSNLADTNAVLSADLFGMTTTNFDDLNIGQVLENAVPYFDFIAPMVYPSHYPPNWNGYKNPAARPYEVVKYSMDEAVKRLRALGENPLKLRPWLQDFDLGADYTKEMVRAQMTATYDAGLDSWMLWDPKNTYTKGALNLTAE